MDFFSDPGLLKIKTGDRSCVYGLKVWKNSEEWRQKKIYSFSWAYDYNLAEVRITACIPVVV